MKVPTVLAPHPSPRSLASRPHYKPMITRALLEARWKAGLADSPPPEVGEIDPLAQRVPRVPAKARPARKNLAPPGRDLRPDLPSPESVREMLVAGISADRICAQFVRRRDVFMIALEEEARLDGEHGATPATPEAVSALRHERALRWERIAVRVSGDPRSTALVRSLYDEAHGEGASRRTYVGRGRRFPEMDSDR